MQIIDRYLAGQFVRTFLIFFISFTGLYVVVDVFANIDEFLVYGRSEGGLAKALLSYYGPRSLVFFNEAGSIITLVAAMFTLTGFQRFNEMTALMAAGIPKRRVLRPILYAAIGVTLLSIVNRELIVPSVRRQLQSNIQELVERKGTPVKPRYDSKTDVYFSGERTFADEEIVVKPNFRLPPPLARYGSQLAAADAVYEAPSADRPGGYRFRGVEEPKELLQRPGLQLEGEAIVISPQDVDWLAADECFLVSDVTFEQLEGTDRWAQLASTRQLISGLHNESLEFGGDVRVAVHARIVQPALDLSLLLIGLPLVLTRENRNAFVAIALCGLVVLGFMLIVMGCQILGSNGLVSPALAAWLPVAIFVPAAVATYDPLRR